MQGGEEDIEHENTTAWPYPHIKNKTYVVPTSSLVIIQSIQVPSTCIHIQMLVIPTLIKHKLPYNTHYYMKTDILQNISNINHYLKLCHKQTLTKFTQEN